MDLDSLNYQLQNSENFHDYNGPNKNYFNHEGQLIGFDGPPPDLTLLAPCEFCNRTFLPASLNKHKRGCYKTWLKTKERETRGGDNEKSYCTNGLEKPMITIEQMLAKRRNRRLNWRLRHEEFLRAVHAARDYAEAVATGNPLPPPPAPIVEPDLRQCTYCHRKFHDKAYDRHVARCKEQTIRNNKEKPTYQTMEAKRRLAVRLYYQPNSRPNSCLSMSGLPNCSTPTNLSRPSSRQTVYEYGMSHPPMQSPIGRHSSMSVIDRSESKTPNTDRLIETLAQRYSGDRSLRRSSRAQSSHNINQRTSNSRGVSPSNAIISNNFPTSNLVPIANSGRSNSSLSLQSFQTHNGGSLAQNRLHTTGSPISTNNTKQNYSRGYSKTPTAVSNYQLTQQQQQYHQHRQNHRHKDPTNSTALNSAGKIKRSTSCLSNINSGSIAAQHNRESRTNDLTQKQYNSSIPANTTSAIQHSTHNIIKSQQHPHKTKTFTRSNTSLSHCVGGGDFDYDKSIENKKLSRQNSLMNISSSGVSKNQHTRANPNPNTTKSKSIYASKQQYDIATTNIRPENNSPNKSIAGGSVVSSVGNQEISVSRTPQDQCRVRNEVQIKIQGGHKHHHHVNHRSKHQDVEIIQKTTSNANVTTKYNSTSASHSSQQKLSFNHQASPRGDQFGSSASCVAVCNENQNNGGCPPSSTGVQSRPQSFIALSEIPQHKNATTVKPSHHNQHHHLGPRDSSLQAQISCPPHRQNSVLSNAGSTNVPDKQIPTSATCNANTNNRILSDKHHKVKSEKISFCSDCGHKYPSRDAKFCCSCGSKRVEL